MRRCFGKDPKKRLRDLTEGLLQLEEELDAGLGQSIDPTERAPQLSSGETHATRRITWQQPIPLVAASAVVGSIITGALVWSATRAAPLPGPVTQFVVNSPDTPLNISLGSREIAISPDGTRIVYASGTGFIPNRQLYLREVGQLKVTPIRGADGVAHPFFSPDGEWIGFQAGGQLKRVPVGGGRPDSIYQLGGADSGDFRGASWGPDNIIVFSSPSGLMQIPAVGGEPEVLTLPDPSLGEGSHRWPDVLPNGRAVLFAARSAVLPTSRIAVVSLETAEVSYLGLEGTNPVYSPTGHIVYGSGGTLRAVGFDAERLELTGNPVSVLEDVTTKGSGGVNFGLSRSGTLIYSSAGGEFGLHSLVWVDQDGGEEPFAEGRGYHHPRVSPDGGQVLVTMVDDSGNRDVYIYDRASRTPTRLTFDRADDLYPLWTANPKTSVVSPCE